VAIEAEIKAKVHDADGLHAALTERATGERSTYSDRYFDFPDRRWTADGHELRVRTITDDADHQTVLLTFKEPVVDHESGSKPEHETTATDALVLITVLTALGAQEIIAFSKQCTNYQLHAADRELLATVVTVPELAGETFIELETTAEPDDLDDALAVVRDVLADLGISQADFTTEQYTDAVARRRRDEARAPIDHRISS
jgi:adenylate cyclase, class 2